MFVILHVFAGFETANKPNETAKKIKTKKKESETAKKTGNGENLVNRRW